MKASRALAVLFWVLLLAGMMVWLVPHWSQQVAVRQDGRARAQVESLLAAGRVQEAVALVRIQPRPYRHPAWTDYERRALTAARDLPALAGLYRRSPESFLKDEEAALLLLRAWLAERHDPRYDLLRKAWRGHEKSPVRWLLLDADALLRAGQAAPAAALLNSVSWTGRDEASRLLRLAILTAPRDRAAAWTYLYRARQVDPRNTDVRSFCGQYLEDSGHPAEATVDYVAALLAEPANPLLHDQLAEFYRRQGSLDLAVKTWCDAIPVAPLDYLWVKALFWSRVVQPPARLPASSPTGALAPLVEAMRQVPPERFWAAEAVAGKPLPGGGLRGRPEVYWLELLEQLRAGRERDAQAMLESAPDSVRALQPALHVALRQLLALRLGGVKPGLETHPASAAGATERHAFFVELDAACRAPALTADLSRFLKGPHAMAAACLAVGWRGAALSLLPSGPLPADVPEWYVYAIAQSLRYNRGAEVALTLLASRPATPLLELLAGELLLQRARSEDGAAKLAPLVARPDDIGDRAAWLLAVLRMEQGRFDDVRAVLAQQPRLAGRVAGREIEARLELVSGHEARAETLYRALVHDSAEARAWLAKRAVLRKDWDEARTLTLELIALMPEEMPLRQSLAQIETASGRK